jgi:hypothetical protein
LEAAIGIEPMNKGFAAIPAHSLAIPSFHVKSMIWEEIDHSCCFDAYRMVIKRGATAGENRPIA